MRFHFVKTSLSKAVSLAVILLLGASFAAAQQQINLTAAPSNLMMPDGNTVPMWGYTCGTVVAGSTANCAQLNAGPGWSPVVITVPTNATGGLTIKLTNGLTFANGNTVPTSLVIVGQLGAGLGTTASSMPSPDHTNAQQITWPIPSPGQANMAPPQGPRVQSFSTEVAAGSPATLSWPSLRPGTYLIESGTHPSIQGPMGLYGILVVTTAPSNGAAGTAYPAAGISPAVSYNSEIPLLFSEIDPVQNNAVSAAVNTSGFSETAVWSGLPGGCGNPASSNYQTCYPPAVNYMPLYYLINGVAFNRNAPMASLFAASAVTGVTSQGSVLVRLVNAGLRMHVPAIVGSQTGNAVPPAVPANGFSLIAEDGNPLPGIPRVQSEVFMAAGKTYDVMINVPAANTTALPIFDRQLSLSGNAIARDAGMLAYISVNGAQEPNTGAFAPAAATANPDTYNLVAGQTLTVADMSKGVIANDVNIYGVQVTTPPTGAAVVNGVTQFTLNSNGTFTYTPASGTTTDSFMYCGNGATSGAMCAMVTLANCANVSGCMEANTGITVNDDSYASKVASSLSIKSPGVLANDSDGAGYPLSVSKGSYTFVSGPAGGTLSVTLDQTGAFNATANMPGTYKFTYKAQNSQGTVSVSAATVTLNFPVATGLAVTVYDPVNKAPITDYRWVIEEDRTFYVDPNKTTNTGGSTIVPTFGTNFHTSYMPLIAMGCTGPLSCESGQMVFDPATGSHINAVCDMGNGVCRQDTTGNGEAQLSPSDVALDPTKRYYISIMPGDAANPFINGYGSAPVCDPTGAANSTCGHGMGGAPITFGQTSVTIMTQASPFPPSKLSVFVFEDDFPLNGEQDGGGGVDVLSPNEPGLGGFNITLFDDAGGPGDATGQMTYDMFNMPLSNSLAGTVDPSTGLDACPIGASPLTAAGSPALVANETTGSNGLQGTGITGTIVTCPKYEADGKTLSPLAGQAVVANLMPGRYGVVATPAADRIGRGEEWLQTNTLDGQKAHDSFLRIGEPSFFQEFGPAGYHVTIGFANPGIINDRKKYVCNGTDPSITGSNCTNSITAVASTERMSRTPDERLYSSGDNSSFAFTQCYASFGDADGEDFAFTKCDQNGKFTLTGLPDGDWRITVFDQWNDMLVDGLSTPVRLSGGKLLDMGQIAMNQWQSNIYTKTFFDTNGNGVQDEGENGLTLVATNNRFRDGSYSNFNNTDLSGNAGFNEIFPLFSWYVIENDTTRYKSTGAHVVYDAGGPADGTPCGTAVTPPVAPCGTSTIGGMMANTAEQIQLPADLQVPGARYCASADCPTGDNAGGSTGRVDPPTWFGTYGWQGFSGQNNFVEFGKKPFAAGETGGIHGEVTYASTRPFDDPALLIHTSWTPNVPGVTINLYQEGTAPDGTTSLKLIDTTLTSSWDDWAQGFHKGPNNNLVPNMNCPGQGTASGTNADLFFFTLYNQPMWLDVYSNGGTPANVVPYNSQFKCFDGMHNWNQVQPAPYDGYYTFPSVTSVDSSTGKPAGSNCHMRSTLEPWGCVPNPTVATSNNPTDPNLDPFRSGTPMLPPGKYVVEMIVPRGYELVKEEDKNILIGDNYIAPVTQEFGGLGNVFILPDQAEVKALYNENSGQNPTQTLGRTTFPSAEGDTGSVETFWPCVGASRIVPDFISLFPQSGEVAPFAGATRNLCDRKEVNLTEQTSALAKFWVFTSVHVAAHFTGVITDDYTSEFDPFSPQFGEKFSPPNLPVSLKDWTGREVSRVYSDQWGTYNGLNYSTWEVNPPNPTGYAPTMMVVCMNDPGPIPGPNGTMITDPLFNPQYSQFCYEIPFMPGQTQYMDTPVVPTSAFAGAGYNNPDCNYPDTTPAISEVDGDGVGPWVSASGHPLTIHSLGIQYVPNNAYTGPSATSNPFNQKTVKRNYGFGGTQGTVTIGGVNATITGWNDSTITVLAPATGGNNGVQACSIQQQSQYKPTGTTTAYCGELVITRGDNQKQSVDTVTVTIGGKAPTHVAASDSIQAAIDLAKPGDLIVVDPTCTPAAGGAAVPCSSTALNGATPTQSASQSAHYEMVLMWKPVRLQGVGAASSIINANTHPAGKMDAWRQRVDCLFGLAPAGTPKGYDAGCGAGWFGFQPTSTNPQVDRLPLEATVGWDATLNGNLAELLQEPTLMGALEGAAITVLSKGVVFPTGSNPFGADTFPTGTTLLQNVPRVSSDHCSSNPNPYPSNFECNPSSIDGLGITDSSQGGGGVFVHAWGHNLQIANNRINSNAGTLSGGINVGQGEFPGAYFGGAGANGVANADPGSCIVSNTTNLQLPYCFDMNVNIHHNMITSNSSTGDELFSATPAGAGGVSFCTGSDYYQFNYNWLCGNLSSGDGGGLGQLGFVYHGDIEHNTVIFNQSTNPTIPANGGGIAIMGAPDVDPSCGSTTDQDCVSAPGTIGPSDGTGPGLVINANLIMGNAAESGSGGGLRLQNINGTDVINFPRTPTRWNDITITNNVIVNNVAGWDGAGISLLDALNVNIINNTVASNDTTASSGVLFNTLGAPLASSFGPTCTSNCGTTSAPQPAGLVSIQNSSVLTSNLPGTITCPPNHPVNTANPTQGVVNGACRRVSYPELYNDVFYQNRSFYIGVGALGSGTTNQQNVVALYNSFTSPKTQAGNQTATGSCPTGASYWDIGVRGDTGPDNHASGVTLAPEASLLTALGTGNTYRDGGSFGNGSNRETFGVSVAGNPAVVSQYCNGSRVPPEAGAGNWGWQVPPGISDASVPNPIFNLTPAATVDEGNNWINISWGPLAETNATTGALLGNYGPTSGSPVIGYITNSNSATTYAAAPSTDFFGNPRKNNNAVDIGAIEFVSGPASATLNVTPTSLSFTGVVQGTTSASQPLTLHNTGTGGATGIAVAVTAPFSRPTGTAGGTCGTTLAAGSTCTINIVYSPGAGVTTSSGTATITANVTVSGSPVSLSGTAVAPLVSAAWAPTSHNFGNATRGVSALSAPSQTFTLTNNGNVNLTGIAQATLTGTDPTEFSIVRLFSTCGPAGGGQFLGLTTLAPGASCTVTVQFRPLTTQTTGAKSANLSITDAAGTQTAGLSGTAQ